jgi:hypothetical protein
MNEKAVEHFINAVAKALEAWNLKQGLFSYLMLDEEEKSKIDIDELRKDLKSAKEDVWEMLCAFDEELDDE